MNLTSVLVVLNEKFNALDVLQDNMKIAGSKIQLLIYNHGLQDPYIIDSIKEICSEYIEDFSPIKKTFSECCNALLRIASGKYVCIFYDYGYLSDDWLSMLIDSHTRIEKSGIISINNLSCLDVSYEMNNHFDLEPVYRNADNFVKGILFFNKEILITIGGLKNNMNLEYMAFDFCHRLSLQGYINYFVPGTSIIKHSEYVDSYLTTPIAFKKEKNLNKTDPFVKIYDIQKSDAEFIEDINNHLDIAIYYSDKFGSVIFISDVLKPAQLQILNVFLTKYNKQLELKSISYFDEFILKNSILGIIVPNNI
jgi:hypothetical protein